MGKLDGIIKKKKEAVYKYIDNEITDEFCVVVVGAEACSSRKKKIGPKIFNRFILHYCTKGKGYFCVNGKTYTVKENNVFLIFPNHVVSYYPDKNDPWEYCWFEYSGRTVGRLNERAGFSLEKPVCVLNESVEEELVRAFLDMHTSLDGKADDIVALTCLYRFFSVLIREQKNAEVSTRSVQSERIKKIVDYINENFSDPRLSVEEIAKFANLNESYLSRFFKKMMGLPPSKYIIDLRMQRAAILLKREDISVKVVAMSVGYSDSLYFTREFRRYYENSPTAFRNEHIQAKKRGVKKEEK